MIIILEFIKMNPMLQFVFLGDLFDDLSDSAESKRKEGFDCLRALDSYGLLETDKSFSSWNHISS